MLVYDDVITRITVFCILFLLDAAQHQRNQTDTSDKHQQRYQQFTGIAQLRRQIQARSYRTKGGNTFKGQCQQRGFRFEYAQYEDEEKQYAQRHDDRRIGTPDRVMRQFPAEDLHPLTSPQYGYKVQHYHCKSIHFDTACRRLRTAADPHQEEINQQRLHAQ